MLTVYAQPARRCGRCARDLPVSAFNRSAELGTQYYCRECQRGWYRENRARHIENVTANTARYRERNAAVVLEHLRAHPCVDCGESDPKILEFDHIGEKDRGVSQLKWSGAAPARLIAEMAKCEVRCVNCHMKRTAHQRGWRKNEIHAR